MSSRSPSQRASDMNWTGNYTDSSGGFEYSLFKRYMYVYEGAVRPGIEDCRGVRFAFVSTAAGRYLGRQTDKQLITA